MAKSLGQGQMLEGCTSLALWYLVENGGRIEFQMTYDTGKQNTKQQCMYKEYIFLHECGAQQFDSKLDFAIKKRQW